MVERGDVAGAERAKQQTILATRQYLKRGREVSDNEEDDDAPLRRVASFEWVLETDHQWRQYKIPGWRYFFTEWEDDTDPYAVPLCLPCADQAGDAVCPVNFMLSIGVNLDPLWCGSHGSHNDLKLTLKHAGLWAHMLLVVMAWKAWKGPYGNHDLFRAGAEHGGSQLDLLETSGGLVVSVSRPELLARQQRGAQGWPTGHPGALVPAIDAGILLAPTRFGVEYSSVLRFHYA